MRTTRRRLCAEARELRQGAEDYYALDADADFDYAKLLAARRAGVRALVEHAQ